MAVDCRAEVHVSDTTLYRVRILDSCLPFDPSTASVLELLFMTPSGVLTKTATLDDDGLSPVVNWYLTYQVVPSDGLGSPPSEFHDVAGRMKIQAFLEWADGKHYHSTIATVDDQGRELRVYPNLA